MRTLDEITMATRRGQHVSPDELIYAVTAYDVLLAQMDLPMDPEKLQLYFVASTSDPQAYVGPENDPFNPEARLWHEVMIGPAGSIKCWSCTGTMTKDERSENDGDCIHCQQEIDLSKD